MQSFYNLKEIANSVCLFTRVLLLCDRSFVISLHIFHNVLHKLSLRQPYESFSFLIKPDEFVYFSSDL